MSIKFPVLGLIMPSDLAGADNGKISPSLLKSLRGTKGKLHHLAATAFNCLQMEAYFAGVDLQATSVADTYRSYEQQKKTFNDRYAGLPTGRTPQVTRKFAGKTYFLKPGKAPSASPGTSNHGWGLAIDIANASGARLDWMMGGNPLLSPVLKYGFSWEVESGPNAEAWHIRYVCGDKVPMAVTEAVAAFPELKA